MVEEKVREVFDFGKWGIGFQVGGTACPFDNIYIQHTLNVFIVIESRVHMCILEYT